MIFRPSHQLTNGWTLSLTEIPAGSAGSGPAEAGRPGRPEAPVVLRPQHVCSAAQTGRSQQQARQHRRTGRPVHQEVSARTHTAQDEAASCCTDHNCCSSRANASLQLVDQMKKVDGLVSGFENSLSEDGPIPDEANAIKNHLQDIQVRKSSFQNVVLRPVFDTFDPCAGPAEVCGCSSGGHETAESGPGGHGAAVQLSAAGLPGVLPRHPGPEDPGQAAADPLC